MLAKDLQILENGYTSVYLTFLEFILHFEDLEIIEELKGRYTNPLILRTEKSLERIALRLAKESGHTDEDCMSGVFWAFRQSIILDCVEPKRCLSQLSKMNYEDFEGAYGDIRTIPNTPIGHSIKSFLNYF